MLSLAAAACMAACALGCAGVEKPVASLEGSTPGVTTLRIDNDLAEGALERVVIAIDGETLALSSVPPAHAGPSTIASLRLPPGAHSIAVRATAKAKGDAVVVVGQQPFWITKGAASIGIALRPAEGDSATTGPVALQLTMLGGRLDAAIDVSDPSAPQNRGPRDGRCASLMPIAGALCRTAIELEEAAQRNDVVAALCLHDKLDEMRRLSLVGDSSTPDNASLAEQRVAMVARLAERCGGSVAAPAPDGVTVTRIER